MKTKLSTSIPRHRWSFKNDIAGGPQGEASADLFGFGLSADVQGAPINVQIGSNAAPVTQAQWSYNDTPYELSLQHLQVTLPAGSPGAQDITISTPTGTSTITKGFHVLESVEDYATADTLLDVLYDSSRQQLYLSAGNHIDVFSLTTNSFLPPITPPSVGGSRQLEGLALTPDGSDLLVANSSDNSVAIVNPDSPSAATARTQNPGKEVTWRADCHASRQRVIPARHLRRRLPRDMVRALDESPPSFRPRLVVSIQASGMDKSPWRP